MWTAVAISTVLLRTSKRASFVRYWTSGHGVSGANAIDMWKRIYSWFDEFLKPVVSLLMIKTVSSPTSAVAERTTIPYPVKRSHVFSGALS